MVRLFEALIGLYKLVDQGNTCGGKGLAVPGNGQWLLMILSQQRNR
jgi:hypothetical protein